MKIELHYHAILREKIGVESEFLSLPEKATAALLLQEFFKRHRVFAPLQSSIRLACNSELIEPSSVLNDGDHVDLLPPFGGG